MMLPSLFPSQKMAAASLRANREEIADSAKDPKVSCYQAVGRRVSANTFLSFFLELSSKPSSGVEMDESVADGPRPSNDDSAWDDNTEHGNPNWAKGGLFPAI
jgi:hypothetical protein